MSSGLKVSKLNFELNPRGNLWFNDESTFGHKLLSKMGWSRGKGLGKNEDGIKENIKIAKKETNTGVGWKGDDVPIAIGCIEYENILQNLQKHFNNPSDKDERFEKSLEQRSRNARNHLHYQKFVRVKDLNRYSEKDMKSIFLEKPQKPESNHPSRPPEATPTFKSQLSVNDYFALKMQKKREEAGKLDMSVEVKNAASSQQQRDTEKALSKKRKFVSESPEPETASENNVSSESTSKKPHKKLKFISEDQDTSKNDAHPTFTQSHLANEEPPAKHKLNFEKQKTSKNKSKKQKPVLEKSKNGDKKKHRKTDCESNISSSVEDSSFTRSSDSEEISKKKKKKKSKKNRLQQLKSCLKSRDGYDLKNERNVSFNEQVSYKILDTSLELCEEINDTFVAEPSAINCADNELENDVPNSDCIVVNEKDCLTNADNNLKTTENGLTNEDIDLTGEQSGLLNEEEQETPACFDLPKSGAGSHFNFWLESQRQASKMKLYKEMAKKIRKDKALRSTNLLDIKGYGNWS